MVTLGANEKEKHSRLLSLRLVLKEDSAGNRLIRGLEPKNLKFTYSSWPQFGHGRLEWD